MLRGEYFFGGDCNRAGAGGSIYLTTGWLTGSGTLQANGQVLWHYVSAQGKAVPDSNPNGSLDNIAGICNETRNVFGLMPHPERASEKLLGSEDGRVILESALRMTIHAAP